MVTYDNNAKVEDGPELGEVLLEAERYPFHQHLDDEDDDERQVQVVDDLHLGFVSVEINVLKTLCA